MAIQRDSWKLINGIMASTVGLLIASTSFYILLCKQDTDDVSRPTTSAFRNYMVDGIASDRRGDLPDAEGRFQAALTLHPQSRVAHLHLARLYERQSRYTDAWRTYQKILPAEFGAGEGSTLDPESFAAYGDLAVRFGHLRLAAQAYHFAIRRTSRAYAGTPKRMPTSAEGKRLCFQVMDLAKEIQAQTKTALDEVGRMGQSIEELAGAAHTTAGTRLASERDYLRAESHFKTAIRFDPKNWHALFQLASVEQNLSHTEESDEHLARAICAAGSAHRSSVDRWVQFLDAKRKLLAYY